MCTACECELSYIWIRGACSLRDREREWERDKCVCMCASVWINLWLTVPQGYGETQRGVCRWCRVGGCELLLPLQKCPWQHSDDAIWSATPAIVTAEHLTLGICWSHYCHLFLCRQCCTCFILFSHSPLLYVRGCVGLNRRIAISDEWADLSCKILKIWRGRVSLWLVSELHSRIFPTFLILCPLCTFFLQLSPSSSFHPLLLSSNSIFILCIYKYWFFFWNPLLRGFHIKSY